VADDRDDELSGILRAFGQQVKLFREQCAWTRVDLAQKVNYGPDLIASIEQGRRIAKPELIEAFDELLGAGGVLRAMTDEVEKARYPVFAREFMGREREAVQLHSYDAFFINGLLQTEEYARAMFHNHRPSLSEVVVEERIAARLARQRLFEKQPQPVFSFVFEEAVLRRPIGGREVWRGQLEHLIELAARPNIDMQIMPIDREEWAGSAGPLTLLETEKGRFAYFEVQTVSRLIADRKIVRQLEAKYGTLRAQALEPLASRRRVEGWLREG
jgi:transcriptional regulator with XRE-family HTH domain